MYFFLYFEKKNLLEVFFFQIKTYYENENKF
jgi:hypothetical protein